MISYQSIVDKIIAFCENAGYTYSFSENKFYGMPFEVNEFVNKEGVKDYLEEVKKFGYKIALASSSTKEWVTHYLGELGLLKYFDWSFMIAIPFASSNLVEFSSIIKLPSINVSLTISLKFSIFKSEIMLES